MRVQFQPRYDVTEIDIPISDGATPLFRTDTLANLFTRKVTIYNDIAATSLEARRFDRFVIPMCNVQGGFVTKADGTIQNIVNAKTVITKAVASYREPSEYVLLPSDRRKDYFTAQVGDFIVLDEVDDVVATAQDYAALKKKYANNGLQIVSVSANLNGMDVDNVTMTNA